MPHLTWHLILDKQIYHTEIGVTRVEIHDTDIRHQILMIILYLLLCHWYLVMQK